MDLKSLMPFGRRDVAVGGDPFLALHREVNRLFDDMSRGMGTGMPALWGESGAAPRLDVKESDGAIEVQAELPGVEEKDVDVQLKDGLLTIKGEKKQESSQEDKGWHLMERSYGSFVRRVALPAEVLEDKASASFKNGVLTISLPKAKEALAKARKIEIKAA